MRLRYVQIGLLAFLISMSGAVSAQDDEELVLPEEEEVELTPEQEYDRIWRQIDALVVYNALLERQIANQEQQMAQIRRSRDQVPELERQVPALLMRMVDALEQFVAMDMPFLLAERNTRVGELKALVESNASDGEKLRRILEAWQVETDYGRDELGSHYTGQLEINGTQREVDFLQLGRIALVYQTLDQEYTGVWDQRNRTWVPLGTAYRNPVRQAIRVARAQIAPEMVLLPVQAPEN
jgi:hypothetical protein